MLTWRVFADSHNNLEKLVLCIGHNLPLDLKYLVLKFDPILICYHWLNVMFVTS